MRKWLILMVTAAVGLVFAGRARPGAAPQPNAEDILFLRWDGGITLVRDLPEGTAVRLPRAVPSTDWSVVVRAVPQGPETRVVALDARSGAELWSRHVAGKLDVKVASPQGRLVALGNTKEGTGYPGGRSSTTLVIVDEDAPEPRIIDLSGNFEPEAFSTDGQSLFVIEYLPPRNPTSYQVRRLDLRTEEVGGVYTVDAELQEAMQGTARVQAASRDGGRLYTLYTLEADGMKHAFVHVLDLDEQWAHCIDLPLGFGTGPEKAIAISVAPNGNRLYAADASAGIVAEVDTEALAVTRTAQASFGSQGRAAHAVSGPDGTLYLGSGTRLLAVDGSTLTPGRSWDVEGRITGIQGGTDGKRLYVGSRDEITILDPATGTKVGVLDPANLGVIAQLGQSTRPLQENRSEIECAC